MRRQTLLLIVAAALAQACSCDQVPRDALTACDLSQVVQGAVQTDILFVIDDSGSMSEEQTNLRDNLSTFITTLQGSPVANDFRVGVTTTSVSNFTNAAVGLQGCLVGPWLDGGSPTLLADFQGQINAVGTGGSGKEQPFRAMELALTTPLLPGCTNNAGFLRPGSRLAVVFLSDEDDCSESGANVADTNTKCHNDAGDGIDWKFTRIESIDHYEGFLRGPIGGQRRDVVLAAIVGVDAISGAPTCGYDSGLSNRWCCGSTLLNSATTCPTAAPACASRSITNNGLPGDTYCCGVASAPYCSSPCATAYDKADRFDALLARFPSNKRVAASVCDTSFATSLAQIAGLIISPTVPLQGEPADFRMLIVGLRAPDGTYTSCRVELAGTPAAATADAVYAPAEGATPATLTFPDTGGCALDQGYEIVIDVVCAG